MFKGLSDQRNANQNNLKFQLTTIRMAKNINPWVTMSERMWRMKNTPPLLVGLQTGTTTLEISLEVLQKTGNRSS